MKKPFLTFLALCILVPVVSWTAGDSRSADAPAAAPETKRPVPKPRDLNPADGLVPDHKLVIYQCMTRLFGNKVTLNKPWGTPAENGVGKFNDFTDIALASLKMFGVTHMYYTGVIAHAVCADYTRFGIPMDDADVIKGRAGSPFAIKDYYDVNPDMAVNVANRMWEFQQLVARTHRHGMKVVIDYVPNHIGRAYKSQKSFPGFKHLGEGDDTTKAFHKDNAFYYFPGKTFKVPFGNQTPGGDFPTKDGKFDENPAKATGNDGFTPSPSMNDWFETVKLNYGVDYQGGRKKHFSPVPATWHKMLHVLKYWAAMGVDGVRCDMVEMVPVEFWAWAVPQVKAASPGFIFIAEIYNPGVYRDYLEQGKFDYLYDKVGTYDTVRRLMSGGGSTGSMYVSWWTFRKQGDKPAYTHAMLRFLENHDEQRVASPGFAGNMWTGVPGMAVSATLSSGPVMLYFGQEVGEPGKGKEGFSGEDGRTTIFDYWGVPAHQRWMNGGRFDGGALTADEVKLRSFYKDLLAVCRDSAAIRTGALYDLHFYNERKRSDGYDEHKHYAYLRYTGKETVLVVANFDKTRPANAKVKLPARAFELAGLDLARTYTLKPLLGGGPAVTFNAAAVTNWQKPGDGLAVTLPALGAGVWKVQ